MSDWIEIERPAPALKVSPDAVAFSVRKGPRGSIIASIQIGSVVARKLKWDASARLRLMWAASSAKLKLDVPTVAGGRLYDLKPNKGSTLFKISSSGVPTWLVRETVKAVTVHHEVLAERIGAGQLIVTLPKEFFNARAAA